MAASETEYKENAIEIILNIKKETDSRTLEHLQPKNLFSCWVRFKCVSVQIAKSYITCFKVFIIFLFLEISVACNDLYSYLTIVLPNYYLIPEQFFQNNIMLNSFNKSSCFSHVMLKIHLI